MPERCPGALEKGARARVARARVARARVCTLGLAFLPPRKPVRTALIYQLTDRQASPRRPWASPLGARRPLHPTRASRLTWCAEATIATLAARSCPTCGWARRRWTFRCHLRRVRPKAISSRTAPLTMQRSRTWWWPASCHCIRPRQEPVFLRPGSACSLSQRSTSSSRQ